MNGRTVLRRYARMIGGIVVVAACAGCVAEPPPRVLPPPPPPDTNVYFDAARGQTGEQQDRDRYECNAWAVRQSRFDPSLPSAPPHLRVRVEPAGPPAGAGVATGAVTGAVLGAAVSRPWEAGEGALVGAVAGAVIGGIADAARVDQARQAAAERADASGTARAALLEQMARNYRRAMAACLEGRGYNVR
jgi:hypothetical protein